MAFTAVAEQAGVNNSLVAHHFGTRDVLIEAALDWSVKQSIGLSQLEELTATEEEFCQSILALPAIHPDLQIFQYEVILESRRRPELAEAVRQLYASYVAALSEGLRRVGLGNQPRAGEAAFAGLDGLVLQLLAGVDPKGFEKAIRYLWVALGGRVTEPAVSAVPHQERERAAQGNRMAG